MSSKTGRSSPLLTSELQPRVVDVKQADYARMLRSLLPPGAFSPNAKAYLPITIHFIIVVAGWIACRLLSWIWWPLIGLVVANSMSCLAFLAHDVAHRSVTKNRYLLYPTELVLWSLMFVPATLWRRLHAAHHAHTNAADDPDRRFLACELSTTGTIAAAVMFPSTALRFNVFCLLYWVLFPIRHGIVALFYPARSKADFVTAKPRYSTADKLWIAFEIAFIAALQSAIWLLAGGRTAFVTVSLVPVCLTSAVVSWYFFTNHGLKPVDDGNDVLAVTTTVMVPSICNILHSNFAYHAEHHLFPNMNPAYYPLVSKLLQLYFPDQYHRIPISQAWSALLRNPIATPSRNAIGTTASRVAQREAPTGPENAAACDFC